MIRIWSAARGLSAPEVCATGWTPPRDAVWIDLLEPTRAEELAIEKAVGLSLPTPEEMNEIEASSRLYRENGAAFVTAEVLYDTDADAPKLSPVTFVLTSGPLITIRYIDPRAFRLTHEQVERNPHQCPDGVCAFLSLLEAIVDRTADVLEVNSDRVEALTDEVFGESANANYRSIMTRLGRAQTANGRIAGSLVSLARALGFVGLNEQLAANEDYRDRLATLNRDVQSLSAHAGAIAGRVTFQLDAALGLINIEQSGIIKIFSVMSVAFMPPTLVASIYGMNFEHMPELDWWIGYPLALLAMVVSGLGPLWWFRRKGWL